MAYTESNNAASVYGPTGGWVPTADRNGNGIKESAYSGARAFNFVRLDAHGKGLNVAFIDGSARFCTAVEYESQYHNPGFLRED